MISGEVPVITVKVGSPELKGAIEPKNLTDRILSLKYEDLEAKADKLTLTIDNQDLSDFDDPIWRQGNFIYISWGYPGRMAVERKLIIKKVHGFSEMTITAFGLEVMLDHVQRVDNYPNMTRSQAARKIAARWGYVDDSVVTIEETDHIQPMIQQNAITDAVLLRKMASAEGMQWYIDWDGFHFHKHDFLNPKGRREVKHFRYFGDQSVSEILEVNIESDVTRIPGAITVAPRPRFPLNIDVTHMSSTEQQWMSEKIIAAGWQGQALDGYNGYEQREVKRTNAKSGKEAKTQMVAIYGNKQLDAVKLEVTVVGDPNIFAKSVVVLENIGIRLSQAYYVKEVHHTIHRGYTCELKCVSSGVGGRSVASKYSNEANAIVVGVSPTGKFVERPPDSGLSGADGKRIPSFDGEGNPAPADPQPTTRDTGTGLPVRSGTTLRPTPGVPSRTEPAGAVQSQSPPEPGGTVSTADADAGVDPAIGKTVILPEVDVVSELPPLAPGTVVLPPVTVVGQELSAATTAATPYNPYARALPGGAGNLDLDNRPYVALDDSTVETVGPVYLPVPGTDNKVWMSAPSITHDGRALDSYAAVYEYYQETGEHLGLYQSKADAAEATEAVKARLKLNPPKNSLEYSKSANGLLQ